MLYAKVCAVFFFYFVKLSFLCTIIESETYESHPMEAILTEIVNKECERYRLIEFGLLSSVEEGVEKLLPFIQSESMETIKDDFDTFSSWRKQVLTSFYKQLGYSVFLLQNKNEPLFSRFIFYMQKRLLDVIRRSYVKSTIDKDLAASGRTVAFKTSKSLTEDTVSLWESGLKQSTSPEEFEKACYNFCKTYFPLDWDKLLNRLKKNDADFWMELFLLIKKLVIYVMNKQGATPFYKEEIEQDTWEKSSLFIQTKLLEGSLPALESSAHFRHYILNVCMNKCHEAYRNNIDRKLVFAGDGNQISEMFDFEDDTAERIDSLDDVDVENDSDVSRALAYILWERLEPYYSRLVTGVETKVKIFLLHYLEDKSYEEIVKIYHSDLPASQLNRWQGKYRQDMVRVRKLLKKRLIEILTE